MQQSMMWRVLPVERREKVMVPEWETVHSVESATVFPQMADVFHFKKSCLQMNAFLTVSTA